MKSLLSDHDATINGDVMRRTEQKLRVGFLLLDSFTLNAFSGFVEAIRLAADHGGRSRQVACGWEVMGKGKVAASCGLSVAATSPLIDPKEVDYVAVCGGNGYRIRSQPQWLDQYLSEVAEAGVPLIGLCTGTFNIARAGLMQGYPACVHWNVADEFHDQFPRVEAFTDRIFLDAGARITCAGSTGASDLALHLIHRHCGSEYAQQSIRHMMMQGQRAGTFPQAHFSKSTHDVKDEVVRRCAALMEQKINMPPSMDVLAAEVGISVRQLDRRFNQAMGQSPSRYFRSMRLSYALWRLTHTTDRIAEIAADAGFSDSAHFHREFRKSYGTSPNLYRRSSNTL